MPRGFPNIHKKIIDYEKQNQNLYFMSALIFISLFSNTMFFFDNQAMVEHLATTGTLGAPRKHRFSEQFHDDILNMVSSLTSDIIRKYKKVSYTIQTLYYICFTNK